MRPTRELSISGLAAVLVALSTMPSAYTLAKPICNTACLSVTPFSTPSAALILKAPAGEVRLLGLLRKSIRLGVVLSSPLIIAPEAAPVPALPPPTEKSPPKVLMVTLA